MLVTNHKTELTSARLFIGQFEMRVLWHVTSFMVANSWNPTDYRITSERAGDILHTSSTIKLVPCYMPHDHFEGRLGLKRMRGSRGARKIAKIDISANHDSSPTTPGDSRGRRGWGSRGIGLNETTQIRYEQERLQGKELFSGTRLKIRFFTTRNYIWGTSCTSSANFDHPARCPLHFGVNPCKLSIKVLKNVTWNIFK